jgi:serine/threonine protein kinase
MSPEQVNGKEVDTRSDIFSFGAMLYEMVTGKRAFDGKSALSVMMAVVEHDPPPVSSLTPLAPPELCKTSRGFLAVVDGEIEPSDHHLFPALAPQGTSAAGSGFPGRLAELSKCAVRSIRVPTLACRCDYSL